MKKIHTMTSLLQSDVAVWVLHFGISKLYFKSAVTCPTVDLALYFLSEHMWRLNPADRLQARFYLCKEGKQDAI